MQGNEIVWIASILVVIGVVGWLVLDWLESTHHWETPEVDSKQVLGRSEHPMPSALEAESELMLCYPLEPFAPAGVWRPQSQEEWTPAETAAIPITDDEEVGLPTSSMLYPREAS